MKKVLFLMATVAMFATVACSQVDDPVDVITADMTTSYAKVAISMPSVGTRAFGDEANFENGTDEGTLNESKVNSIALVLYNDNMVVGSGAPIDGALTNANAFGTFGEENTIEKTDGIVFKLSLNEGAPKPNKVVAFINTDPVSFDLSEVEKAESTANKVEISDTFLTGANVNSFPMTNSGYYNGTTYTVAAALDEESFYADASAAGATTAEIAATIFVERLAAKVTVTNSATSGVPENMAIVNVDGDEVTIDFEPTKWGATGTAKDMYLLKKKFTYDSTTDAWMNKEAWSRSLWAEGTNWGVDYTDGYLEDGEKTSTDILNYLSFDEINTDLGKTIYVPEHTYDYKTLASEPLFNPIVPSTSAIIIGSYKLTGNNVATYFGAGTEGFDFYLRYTGATGTGDDAKSNYTIYNKSQLIAYLISRSLNIETSAIFTQRANETAINNSTDLTSYFDVKKNDEGKYEIAEIADAPALYYQPNTGTFQQINATALTYSTFSTHYNMGQAYFYVPIKHNEGQKDNNGYYGVVRNHAYELNITAITGLGAPLDEDLTEGEDLPPIVPKPDDLSEAYIKATINILQWHKVGQDVELK